MQNNTLDIKGNAHLYNGVNATFTSDRFQNEDSAIRFAYGFYQVPAGVYFSGDFTISVWIRLNKIGNWARIIDFGNGSALNNIVLASCNGITSQPVLVLYDSFGISKRVAAASFLEIGNWTHIAFTLNGTIGKMFINGIFNSQSQFFITNNIKRESNYVGRSNWAGNENLNADLDDLIIINRSLSDSEIIELKNISIATTKAVILQGDSINKSCNLIECVEQNNCLAYINNGTQNFAFACQELCIFLIILCTVFGGNLGIRLTRTKFIF